MVESKAKLIVDGSGIDFCKAVDFLSGGEIPIDLLGVIASYRIAPERSEEKSILSRVTEGESPLFSGCPAAMIPSRRNVGINTVSECTQSHGVGFLIQACRLSEEPVTLLAMGPLTDLAMALRIAPDICGNLKQVVIQSGNREEENHFGAEGIFRADPEAADIVFLSGVPITMIPRETAMLAPEIAWMAGVGCLLDPDILTKWKSAHFRVCLDAGLGAGVLLAEPNQPHNARIVQNINWQRLAALEETYGCTQRYIGRNL